MKIPYLDLTVKDPIQKREILEAVDKVLSHGRILLGPEVEELERSVAQLCGVKYALGVNSGTDALYLALKAIDVGPGDEVITASMSFIATANAISLTGAKPVFVDIRNDLNIDPAAIEAAITPRTKALVIVHFTGKLCEMPLILEIAGKHGIPVVEDAAQSFCARYKNQVAGSFGLVSSFSMNPMKVFAACGEAGIVVTNDQKLRERLEALRYNGLINRTECHYKSLNGRIDTLQAAILLVKLKYLDGLIARRRKIAEYYSQNLKNHVTCPVERENYFDVYFTYVVRTEKREQLMAFLAARGIETKIHHSPLMPQHPAYAQTDGNFPRACKLVREILSLPDHEKMTDEEVEYVVRSVRGFFA